MISASAAWIAPAIEDSSHGWAMMVGIGGMARVAAIKRSYFSWRRCAPWPAASLAAGLPVVSVSLGDTARFLFGGTRRRDAVESIFLESGDVFVFGGAARLRYHGVARILPGTAPPSLGLDGRFNLTFRQYEASS